MKIAFAGTPEFAACALQALLDAGFNIPLVLTQPDRPAGRGMSLQQSAVKKLALAHNLPVDQPEKLRTPEQQAALRACQPDVLVVAAYGLLLPQAVLDIPRLGCLNIHGSLLPRWRGAAPIHRAIESGDTETGITIMQMDAGLDTGAMLLREALPITDQDTTGSLHDKLATLGGKMIVQALQQLEQGTLTATVQPEAGVTYAHKISKAESALDFTQSAQALANKVRAFNPFPGCTVTLEEGGVIKIWHAHVATEPPTSATPGQILSVTDQGIVVACGQGALCLTELQKAGARRLPVNELLRGQPLSTKTYFLLPVEN